jgi:hypothetical protein
MLKINHSLKDEIRELQAEILKHVGSDCGGIPEASSIIHHSAIHLMGPKALRIGDQSYFPTHAADTDCSSQKRNEGRHGCGGAVTSPDATDAEAMRSAALNSTVVSDPRLNSDPNSDARSAEDIVRAVLGE